MTSTLAQSSVVLDLSLTKVALTAWQLLKRSEPEHEWEGQIEVSAQTPDAGQPLHLPGSPVPLQCRKGCESGHFMNIYTCMSLQCCTINAPSCAAPVAPILTSSVYEIFDSCGSLTQTGVVTKDTFILVGENNDSHESKVFLFFLFQARVSD